ncbi:MAG TPA: hypothetical protein VFY25_16240, partial [Anaerolineales bacterium]|nr:hypothetical protein [Anaerolineales bacterium]
MRQAGFISLLVFVLIGCQPASTGLPVTIPAETRAPSATPSPAQDSTPVPTPSPASTPTVSPAQLVRRASPICENAYSALFQAGSLKPPFAVMKKTSYADSPSWELDHQLPHLGSLAATEVKTVFCISETRTQTGTNTDGSPAYQLFWDVRAISWPDGGVIGRNSFTGPAGGDPYPGFAAWVFNQVDHPDFLQFNEAVTALALSPVSELTVFGSARVSQTVDRQYQARIFWLNTSSMQIISAVD